MRVTVTEEDIRNGVAGDGDHCAIACALRRTNGEEWCVEVPGVWNHTTFERWRLPETACRFAEDFDAGQDVRPFSFDMKPAEGYP